MSAKRTNITAALFIISLALEYAMPHPATAAGPDMSIIVEMVNSHHEMSALEIVVTTAADLGGWGPAPGDQVVYDEAMPWWVRGEVLTADLPPAECAIPRFSHSDHCLMASPAHEHQIRFGQALFFDTQEDGTASPRPLFDDVLSTYIEEVGHSWQEYLYETGGLGSGPRIILTTWEEAFRWRPGREYQIKRYILNLDESLIVLSEGERDRLLACICDPDGYANPLGHDVPPYGSPPGWPQPDRWLVTTPSQDDLQAFCEAG